MLDIEQYDTPSRLPHEKFAILLMATYGDGDPTDSAGDFWSWLSEAAESAVHEDLLQVCAAGWHCFWGLLLLQGTAGKGWCACCAVLLACDAVGGRWAAMYSASRLTPSAGCPARIHNCASACATQGVSFGVFGLGNRQYEHFCAMGNKVSTAMKALGAAEVLPRGEGDDDKDIDEDFDRWCAALFAALDSSDLVAKGEVRLQHSAGSWRRPEQMHGWRGGLGATRSAVQFCLQCTAAAARHHRRPLLLLPGSPLTALTPCPPAHPPNNCRRAAPAPCLPTSLQLTKLRRCWTPLPPRWMCCPRAAAA